MPQPVFDVVAKNPEIEHIPQEVEPPAMKEHGSKQRQDAKEQSGRLPISRTEVETGYDSEDVEKLSELLSQRKLVQKHNAVEDDEEDRDERHGARAIRVSKGNHGRSEK